MGTYAFGREGRADVIRNIANLRPFERGGISGKSGGCRDRLRLPREYALGLIGASYVVYCYDTPIAWMIDADESETGRRINYIPDWQYSATTTYHQSLVMEAWERFEDPNPTFSRRENRGTQRARTSDERYGRGAAETRAAREARLARQREESLRTSEQRMIGDAAAEEARRRAEADHQADPLGHLLAAGRFVTNHRGVRYDSLVERDTSFERDMAETSMGRWGDEDRQRADMARLLDPRFRNPDWTPFGDQFGNNLPDDYADARDVDRVEEDLRRPGWHPGHP